MTFLYTKKKTTKNKRMSERLSECMKGAGRYSSVFRQSRLSLDDDIVVKRIIDRLKFTTTTTIKKQGLLVKYLAFKHNECFFSVFMFNFEKQ